MDIRIGLIIIIRILKLQQGILYIGGEELNCGKIKEGRGIFGPKNYYLLITKSYIRQKIRTKRVQIS